MVVGAPCPRSQRSRFLCAQLKDAIPLLLHRSGLFCLDATHGLNDSGHQVFSLLHISDNRTGVIVMTFTVPNNYDHTHVLCALKWLKSQFPAWEPYLFMTDDCSKGAFATLLCRLRAAATARDCLLSCLHAEFNALATLFPNALLRLCIFHVKRNVVAEVRRSAGSDSAQDVDVLLEKMSRLTPCPDDRKTFFTLVEALHNRILCGERIPEADLAVHPLLDHAALVAKLKGMDEALHVVLRTDALCCPCLQCRFALTEWMEGGRRAWGAWQSQPVPQSANNSEDAAGNTKKSRGADSFCCSRGGVATSLWFGVRLQWSCGNTLYFDACCRGERCACLLAWKIATLVCCCAPITTSRAFTEFSNMCCFREWPLCSSVLRAVWYHCLNVVVCLWVEGRTTAATLCTVCQLRQRLTSLSGHCMTYCDRT